MWIHKNLFSHLHKTSHDVHTKKKNNKNPKTTNNQPQPKRHLNTLQPYLGEGEKQAALQTASNYRLQGHQAQPPCSRWYHYESAPWEPWTRLRSCTGGTRRFTAKPTFTIRLLCKFEDHQRPSQAVFNKAIRKVWNRPGLLCALQRRPVKALCSTAPTLYYLLVLVC